MTSETPDSTVTPQQETPPPPASMQPPTQSQPTTTPFFPERGQSDSAKFKQSETDYDATDAPRDTPEMDEKTNLPRKISLGAVLSRIELAPHEIASMLQNWGLAHQGTAQADISPKLADAARAVLNPASYGGKSPDAQPARPTQPAPEPAKTPVFESLHESRS